MIYLKPEIEQNLDNTPNKLLKEISLGLEPYLQYYSVLRFNNLINFIKSSFNAYNFFKVFGVNGSGKSSFKALLKNTFNSNINVFEYNCSEITELDDIFFKFYKFIGNHPLKSDFLRITKNNNKSLSIDDKIIHYLKNTNGNIVLIFDSFEKLLDENSQIKEENIKSFFEFLSTINKIKVIIFTSVNITNTLMLPQNITFETRLEPLSFEQMQEFLAIFKINTNQLLFKEIYEQTNGYIFTLKFLATAVRIFDIPLDEILHNAIDAEVGLKVFLAQMILSKLSATEKKILYYFAFFRHEINSDILKTIDKLSNIETIIDTLVAYMLIDKDNDNYRMRSFLKTIVYNSLSQEEKANLHKKIATFYAEQIPLKPSERVLELSRTTMYSEKFYHFNLYSKFEKKKDLQDTIVEYNNQNDSKLNSNTIQYIASTQFLPDFQLKSKDDDDNANLQALKDFRLFDKKKKDDINEENFEINKDFEIEDDFFNEDNNSVNDALTLLQKGTDLFNKGETLESISFLQDASTFLKDTDIDNYYLAQITLSKALTDNYKYYDAKTVLENLLSDNQYPNKEAEILSELATVYEYSDDMVNALRYYEKALDIAINANLPDISSKIYFKLALLYDNTYNIDKALYNYRLAVNDALNTNDRIILAAAYSNIASIYSEKQDFKQAIQYYEKALVQDEYNENFDAQTKTLASLGRILIIQNNTNSAIKHFIKATQCAKKTSDKYIIASAYLDLGDAFFKMKDFKNATKAYILSKKHIDTTISTDSKNKIERRFEMVVKTIGETKYKSILNELRNA